MADRVVAKFNVQQFNQNQVTAGAVMDDGIPENQRFHKYTPAGSLSLTIDNPPALEFFKDRVNKAVYVTFSDEPL